MWLVKSTVVVFLGMCAVVVGLVVVLFFMPLGPFETAIAAAFDGNRESVSDSKYVVVCAGFDCDELLPRLPPVSAVRCKQSMVSDNLKRFGHDIHIVGLGACCVAQFGDVGSTEVHIYRQLTTYKILLTEPRMSYITKALDKKPTSG